MKVGLRVHGGLAGAARLRAAPRELDSAALAPADAAKLQALVAAARGAGAPGGADKARDAMSYSITIRDAAAETELRASDADMPPAFSALLDFLQERLGSS